MLEKTETFKQQMFHQQITRDAARFDKCKQTVTKLADQYDPESANKIFKEMDDCHFSGLIKMDTKEKKKLERELEQLSNDSKVSTGAKYHYYSWQKLHFFKRNLLKFEYKVEEHCDRFSKFVDKELRIFEHKVEVNLF